MKKLLLFFLMFTAHLACTAEDRLLVVEMTNGDKVSFALSAHPEITFSGQTMHMKTDSQSQDFEIANVSNYYFESVTTGIVEPQAKDLHISNLGNGQIVVSGINSPSEIKLYATGGLQVQANLSYSEGKAVIFVSSLPKGVYILSINKQQNIKFYKK